MKDERYVANPVFGNGHNRGKVVDLTILNAFTGKELDMGTSFDNFSDTAQHSFTNLGEEILQNRLLLRTVMEKHGLKAFESEWWHYFLADGIGPSYWILLLKTKETPLAHGISTGNN